MQFFNKKTILTFLSAIVLGAVLHFLFQWCPHVLTALISPVRESLWEHLKILLVPLSLAGLYLTRKQGLDALAPWLLSLPLVGGAMLLSGYLYHITFHGDGLIFDLILYVVALTAGFILPHILAPIIRRPGIGMLSLVLTLILIWFIIWFTFFPPDTILFRDLSHAQPSFYLLPSR